MAERAQNPTELMISYIFDLRKDELLADCRPRFTCIPQSRPREVSDLIAQFGTEVPRTLRESCSKIFTGNIFTIYKLIRSQTIGGWMLVKQ